MALDRLLSLGADLAPLRTVAGAPAAVLSVPDAARPYVVATLAELGAGPKARVRFASSNNAGATITTGPSGGPKRSIASLPPAQS